MGILILLSFGNPNKIGSFYWADTLYIGNFPNGRTTSFIGDSALGSLKRDIYSHKDIESLGS
jgi:hypothetical protein